MTQELCDKWAKRLDGRGYRQELSTEEETRAAADGVVIAFGASDDLLEFRGAVSDEYGVYNGGQAILDCYGLVPEWESLDHDEAICAAYFQRKTLPRILVAATWGPKDLPGYSWKISVNTQFSATFTTMEDGEPFCQGVVFAMPGK